MTVKDLMDDVALLGAEKYIDSIDETAKPNFFRAATKAYAQINDIRPRKGVIKIVREYGDYNVLTWRAKFVGGDTTVDGVEKDGSVSFDFHGKSDFMRFLSPPYTPWGTFLDERTEYYIPREDFLVLLLHEGVTEYLVDYYMKPQTFSENDVPEEDGESTVIKLDSDLLPLLANLTGYYVLMEDNPAVSATLKRTYDEQYALVLRNQRSKTAGYFTNGW